MDEYDLGMGVAPGSSSKAIVESYETPALNDSPGSHSLRNSMAVKTRREHNSIK